MQNNGIFAPLGPGDLIDRAIRFYRKNFWTFILMAAPPVVVGTVVSVVWTFIARSYLYRGGSDPFENLPYYLFTWAGTSVIWFTESVATLAVMGGASRNFVRHLLYGEPITFRDTYRNLWGRFGTLVVASIVVVLLISMVGGGVLYFGLSIGMILVFLIVALLSVVPPLAFIAGVVLGLAAVLGSFWLFFLIASRFAYVPQSVTVEGLGVFSSISRSASLASGNVKRFAALFAFTFLAVYSALAIFYIPLGWYAWYQGVETFEFFFNRDLIPAWYEIASQLIWQTSVILLSPVWMVGLCLLYVDERVRHEGYDIELMAARHLGEIPDVPQEYLNPLQPALVTATPQPGARSPAELTSLNLK